MRIDVNKECIINDENIAPCREERLVAISITDKNKSEDNGFINYTLAIENYQRCCEEYGALCEVYSDDTFVKYIEHDYEITEEIKNFVLSKNTNMSELFKDDEVIENYMISVAYGRNDEIIAIGFCYNIHNGFYAHRVFTDLNNKNIEVVKF